MNSSAVNASLTSTGSPSLVRCCAWLVLAMAVAWGGVAWYAQARTGADGVWVATLAGVVTLAGSLLALVLSSKAQGPNAAMLRLAYGMVFRMGVPLAGCVAMMQWPWLADQGGLAMMAVFYFVGLAVETPLSLKFIERKPAAALSAARREMV